MSHHHHHHLKRLQNDGHSSSHDRRVVALPNDEAIDQDLVKLSRSVLSVRIVFQVKPTIDLF